MKMVFLQANELTIKMMKLDLLKYNQYTNENMLCAYEFEVIIYVFIFCQLIDLLLYKYDCSFFYILN